MSEDKPKDGGLKYIIGLLVVTTLRLMPRLPNMEPIMATAMPFSKGYGWLRGTVFAMVAILLYDMLTHTWGPWTLVTAPAYGLVSCGAYFYLRNKPNNVKSYMTYAIAGTLFFDIVTGVGMGYFILNTPLLVVIAAQIPFTLMHLASSMVTAAFSPMIYKWVVTNPDLTFGKAWHKFTAQA